MVASFVAGILAESNGGGTLALLALGPAGGAGVYWGLYRYYRNTDKSHGFEHETRVEAQSITGTDRKVNEIKGTKRSSIEGGNHTSHRKRVERVG